MNDRQYARETFDPTAYRKEDAPRKEEPDAKPAEKAALLPALNDPYAAGGFVESEVSRLVLVMGKDGFRIGGNAYIVLQYVHMGIGQLGFTANGQVFSFVFADLQPKLVTVHGRNLQRIFDYISLRRMPWIRQADRDFRAVGSVPDNDPFISRIEVEDWKRMPEQAASLSDVLNVHGIES
jgi:hypothetical protein